MLTDYQNTKWNSPKPVMCSACSGRSIDYKIDANGFLVVMRCEKYQFRDENTVVVHPIKLAQDDDKSILSINNKKIALEKLTLESLKDLLFKMYVSPSVREGAIQFFMEYSKSQRAVAKQNILENPDDKQICRPIGEQEVTNINLFNRNAIFLILNNHERKKLTEIGANGKVLDVLKHRHIKSWSGDHEIHMQGPVLCDHDKLIFDACLKLHHEKGFKGIKLQTSFSEVWRALGNKSRMGEKNILSLKRAMARLAAVNVEISSKVNAKNFFWSGGIIDTYSYVEAENNKYSKVIILFNNHMINVYLDGGYSTLNMESLLKLKSYPRRMFEFLVTHKEYKKTIGLNKWKEIIGIEDNVPSFTFRQRIKEAITELKSAGYLTPESGFIKKNEHGDEIIFTDFCYSDPKF